MEELGEGFSQMDALPCFQGWTIQGERTLRGKARGWREGVFLGGTHFVRPRGKATRKPRHNMIIGGKRTFGGLMGRFPGGSEAC